MPFIARCPNCHRETAAEDDDLGHSVSCPGCRSEFVLVPELAATTAARWVPTAAPTPVTAPETPDTGSEVAEATDAPSEAETPTAQTPVLPPTRVRTPRAAPPEPIPLGFLPWVFAGAACLAAVLAGVSASVGSITGLLVPCALAGLLLGIAALVGFIGRDAGVMEFAVPGIPTAGCALLLLVVIVAPDYLSPQYEASRQKRDDDLNAIRPVPLGGELVPPEQLGSAEAGIDASRFALQRGNMRVRVSAVSFGPIPLDGKDGKKATLSKERYLAVELAFQHLGGGEAVTVLPWGSTAPRPVPEPKLTAAGKDIPLAAKGRPTGELTIPPSGVTTVRLLFPEGQLAEPLTLALPTDAWGQAGVFRFRIPVAMVRGGLPKAKG